MARHSANKDPQQAASLLKEAVDNLSQVQSFISSSAANWFELDASGKFSKSLLSATKIMEDCIPLFMEAAATIEANRWLSSLNNSDITSYQEKKRRVGYFNNVVLKDMSLAVGIVPHILLAVGSRDGYGRYTIENKVLKSRHGAYQSIKEIIPVSCIKHPGRLKRG